MGDKKKLAGLEKESGDARAAGQNVTGDREAPPAEATGKFRSAVEHDDVREAQPKKVPEPNEDDPSRDDEARRKRAYAIWESEGRPEGRHQEHWHAAGEDRIPEPGTSPWTEGP